MIAWESLLVAVGLFAAAVTELPEYEVRRTAAADGLLHASDDGWSRAAAIEWGADPYRTRFRALWDDRGLWLRWDVDDAHPWHTLTERDAPLWDEEVVEIFVDPDGDGRDYAELEINPAGVVTDLLVEQGMPDLRADIRWDVQDLLVRVQPFEGGWTAIAHLPWTSLTSVPGAEAAPVGGDRWRFNVFRIKRPHGPEAPEREVVLSAWSPIPGGSFHVPEVFGWMHFRA